MLYMILQLFNQFIACFGFIFRRKYYSCLDNHSSNWVGNACNGALNNGWMGHQGILYFKRTNAIA